MGYYIKMGLVFMSSSLPKFVDEYLYLMEQNADIRIDDTENFISIVGEYKADWDAETATKAFIQRLRDEEIPFCLKTRGEEGEFESDALNPTKDQIEAVGLSGTSVYADLWVESLGDGFVPSASVIPQVFVDLETGTIVNGPIARVPVERLSNDLADSEVIAASELYRLWDI